MATARARLAERMKRKSHTPAQLAWDEFEDGDDSVSSIDQDSVPFGSDSPESSERDPKRRREYVDLRSLQGVDAYYQPSDVSVRNRVFTTEEGDMMRIVPSGIRQDQRYLTVPLAVVPEKTLGRREGATFGRGEGINPSRPLTEDGYLNDRERRLGVPAFRPEFVKEVVRRQQVLESHPDYAFLSNLAAELDMGVEDTFIDTSVSRALATAQAVQDQIRSRDLARRVRVSRVSDRLQGAEEALAQARSGQRANRSPNEPLLFTTVDRIEDLNRYRVALGQSHAFLSALLAGVMFTESPGPETLVRPATTAGSFDDNTVTLNREIILLPFSGLTDSIEKDDSGKMRVYLQFSSVLNYLRNVSPSRAFMGRKFLNLYETLRSSTNKSSALMNTLFAYAALEFLVSMMSTAQGSILSGLTNDDFTDPNSNVVRNDINWVPLVEKLKARTILNTLYEESEGEGPTSPRRRTDPIEYLFAEFLDHDVVSALTGSAEEMSNFLSTVSYVTRVVHHIYANNTSVKERLAQVVENTRDAYRGIEGPLEKRIGRGRTLFEDDVVIRRAATAFGSLIDLRRPVNDYDGWTESLGNFRDTRKDEIQQIEQTVAILEREVEELESDLRTREIEGGPPETGGVASVPVAPNPEWAFAPINTGILKIQGWVLNAIKQANTFIHLYLPRSWRRINSETFQRDPIMSPIFATLCATYVTRAKVGNPRMYMRDKMKKENIIKRASILQSMKRLRFTRGRFQ